MIKTMINNRMFCDTEFSLLLLITTCTVHYKQIKLYTVQCHNEAVFGPGHRKILGFLPH